MGNKIVSTKKAKKLTSAELRKKKKDRMARRKRGEEVFCKLHFFITHYNWLLTLLQLTRTNK